MGGSRTAPTQAIHFLNQHPLPPGLLLVPGLLFQPLNPQTQFLVCLIIGKLFVKRVPLSNLHAAYLDYYVLPNTVQIKPSQIYTPLVQRLPF
jgi:hypothetical protein